MNNPQRSRKRRSSPFAEQDAEAAALGRATLTALGLDPDNMGDVREVLDATRKMIRRNHELRMMAQAIATIEDHDERAVMCAQLIERLEVLAGFDVDEFSRLCGLRQSRK
jgi:hypothetical protein